MTTGVQSLWRGPSDWRVRAAGMVGAAVGAAVALIWRPDFGGFWPGVLLFVVFLVVGNLLGHFVGRMLFKPSPGSPSHSK